MTKVVVVTFQEGDETDREVYGPFPNSGFASAWIAWFEAWFADLPQGGRTISEIALMGMSDPDAMRSRVRSFPV